MPPKIVPDVTPEVAEAIKGQFFEIGEDIAHLEKATRFKELPATSVEAAISEYKLARDLGYITPADSKEMVSKVEGIADLVTRGQTADALKALKVLGKDRETLLKKALAIPKAKEGNPMTTQEMELLVDKVANHLEGLMKRRAVKCDNKKDVFLDIVDYSKASIAKGGPPNIYREIGEELKKRRPYCSTLSEDVVRAEDPQDDWIPTWMFRCPCEKVIEKQEE